MYVVVTHTLRLKNESRCACVCMFVHVHMCLHCVLSVSVWNYFEIMMCVLLSVSLAQAFFNRLRAFQHMQPSLYVPDECVNNCLLLRVLTVSLCCSFV